MNASKDLSLQSPVTFLDRVREEQKINQPLLKKQSWIRKKHRERYRAILDQFRLVLFRYESHQNGLWTDQLQAKY